MIPYLVNNETRYILAPILGDFGHKYGRCQHQPIFKGGAFPMN
jgi:hypothetical protein